MKDGVRCSCGCGSSAKNIPEYQVPTGDAELTLAELPVGIPAIITRVLPDLRGRKKFADVGLVAGTQLMVEARAPFGGLIRVKFLDTSMALHRGDATGILLRREDSAK